MFKYSPEVVTELGAKAIKLKFNPFLNTIDKATGGKSKLQETATKLIEKLSNNSNLAYEDIQDWQATRDNFRNLKFNTNSEILNKGADTVGQAIASSAMAGAGGAFGAATGMGSQIGANIAMGSVPTMQKYGDVKAQGGNDIEAILKGLGSGGIEVLSEKFGDSLGGIKLDGVGGIVKADNVVKNLTNKVGKTLAKHGIDMTTEGVEELISLYGNAIIDQKAPTIEEAVEAFIGGALGAGVLGVTQSSVNALAKKGYKVDLQNGEITNQVNNTTEKFVPITAELPMTKEGDIDRKAVIQAGLENARAKNNPKNTGTKTYVKVKETGKDVVIGKSGLTHGLDRRIDKNAYVTMHIGDIVENAKYKEQLKNEDKKAQGAYTMVSYGKDNEGNVHETTLTVKQYKNIPDVITDVEDVLYAVNAKQKSPTSKEAGFDQQSRDISEQPDNSLDTGLQKTVNQIQTSDVPLSESVSNNSIIPENSPRCNSPTSSVI